MKKLLAIATLALMSMVVPTIAATQGAAQKSAEASAFVWDGAWQGTTVSGQPLVLELRAQGQRLSGRLTVGKQSASIVNGKIVGDAFALTTGKIDGRAVDASGRHVGDGIEFTIEGAKDPLTLSRAR